MKAISTARANSREQLKFLPVALTVSFLAACAAPPPPPFPDYHDGYWVTQVEEKETGEIVTWINDLHANPESLRVTVYAQARHDDFSMGKTLPITSMDAYFLVSPLTYGATLRYNF